MPTYTPGLNWTRSDGTQDTWPTEDEMRPSNVHNWWEKLPLTHEKYKLYEEKTGAYLAEKKGIKAAHYRIPMPENYALFSHHKPDSGGKGERQDVYLRGCGLIGKKYFRSPNEFAPHAEWLMDTSKSIESHETCQCIYNRLSDTFKQKKQAAGTGTTPKRPPTTNAEASSSKKTRKEAQAEEEQPTAIVPERSIDMSSGRRHRKGEMVWFAIDWITSPDGSVVVTHWPALISNIVEKRIMTEGLSGGTSAMLNAMSGVKPAAKKRAEVVFDYCLRPLGFFSSSGEVIRRAEDLLPWLAGNELLGGTKGWDAIGKESGRVMKQRVAAELNELKGKGIAVPTEEADIERGWKEKLARRYPYKEMPKDWDTVVFRLALAIKIGTAITNSWSQTDKIDIVPGMEINPEDREAIESQLKTLYQGIWWGGERIWLEDMVRLKKHRIDLPREALPLPEAGAADRSVMFRVRMITVEVSPDSTEEHHAWRCLLYGDVYEIPDVKSGQFEESKEDEWALANPKALKGCYYRKLNEGESEVTVDIMDVAGRVYPDLLEPSTQKWFAHASLSEQENSRRVHPGDSAKSLTGSKPGTIVGSKSDKWKEDLYTIVSEANKSVEGEMKAFYSALLASGSNAQAAPNSGASAQTAPSVAPPVPAAGAIAA